MRAALMWTINDFPAYGMLSGWSTAGRLACPVCMSDTKAFYLENGRKHSWFDCHRRWLGHDHAFRRNVFGFTRNRVETDAPPRRMSGEETLEQIQSLGIGKVHEIGSGNIRYNGYNNGITGQNKAYFGNCLTGKKICFVKIWMSCTLKRISLIICLIVLWT